MACSYVFPNSESVHSYEKSEQATKNSFETEYFTLNPGYYPKISFHYENFETYSIAHGYEKLGKSKIYIQFFA